ncbi:MAG: DEAD/DEAH box helicase [Gammaproteobacteria bacterium]|nr:DEAD/DEAH box helicase [Gammaproteobacteria bacterium]
MSDKSFEIVIQRHGVLPSKANPFRETKAGADLALTDFQAQLLQDSAPIRIASAPTGAGKTFAFELAPLIGGNILFIVPTRRLAQNLLQSVREIMHRNGWNNEDIKTRLDLWTSDASQDELDSGSTPFEIRWSRVLKLRGEGGFSRNGSFIIATPESIGRLLLRPPLLGAGQTSMSIKDLLSRDHIVFDEFHTIDARGFGLACALCQISSKLSSSGQKTQITFLSATPIDITGTLTAFGIDENKISICQERVKSWLIGDEPDDARIIHGNVEISFGHYQSIQEACRGESSVIANTLSNGYSVVVIFDSLARAKGAREELSEIFRSYGIEVTDFLTINSIDDAKDKFQDQHGIGGRNVDPRKARVILATSSIEIGVTFSTNLMIMEPGYGDSSFLQRVGRVSRGDLPGRIVVVSGDKPPSKFTALQKLEGREVGVEDFTRIVLKRMSEEFSETRTPRKLNTYGKLSNRAIWCACLFWCALRRAKYIHTGERSTLMEFQPYKVRLFEDKLKHLKDSKLFRPKAWSEAFIEEAMKFRDIEPRVYVCFGEDVDSIPESMAGRYPEISGGQIFEHEDTLCIQLARPLESILRMGETQYFCSKVKPLAPLDGIILPHIQRGPSAARELAQILKRQKRHSFGEKGDQICEIANELISMTGVFPIEEAGDITDLHRGSTVL